MDESGIAHAFAFDLAPAPEEHGLQSYFEGETALEAVG